MGRSEVGLGAAPRWELGALLWHCIVGLYGEILLLLLRLRLRRRRLYDYYYDYDYYYYQRLLVLPTTTTTTTTTTAITMHWLLASLLVLPPPRAPLPLVGLKLDARRTELVFQLCLCLAALLRAGVDDAMSTTLPRQKHAPMVQLWMGHTGR